MGKCSLYCLLFNLFFDFLSEIYKSGKIHQAKYPYKDQKLNAFSQNWNSVNAKKHKFDFFVSEEVFFMTDTFDQNLLLI